MILDVESMYYQVTQSTGAILFEHVHMWFALLSNSAKHPNKS